MISSELRIGNYIFEDEGILSKINGFQPYGHSIRCDQNEGCELLIDLYPQDGTIKKGYEIDINTCKPIPLTEDWLIRFGFGGTREYYYDTEIGAIEFYFEDEILVCDIYDSRNKNIKYVHQLQNLYFALTGKELK